jgi:hypothetical protein
MWGRSYVTYCYISQVTAELGYAFRRSVSELTVESSSDFNGLFDSVILIEEYNTMLLSMWVLMFHCN